MVATGLSQLKAQCAEVGAFCRHLLVEQALVLVGCAELQRAQRWQMHEQQQRHRNQRQQRVAPAQARQPAIPPLQHRRRQRQRVQQRHQGRPERHHPIRREPVLSDPQPQRVNRKTGQKRQAQGAGVDQHTQRTRVMHRLPAILNDAVEQRDMGEHHGQQDRRRVAGFPQRLQTGERQADHENQQDQHRQRQQEATHRLQHVAQRIDQLATLETDPQPDGDDRRAGHPDKAGRLEQRCEKPDADQLEQASPEPDQQPERRQHQQRHEQQQAVVDGMPV